MPPPLVQLRDIALTFGGTPLLAGVELAVSAGERVCLVGRNGSGKTTLLKIAAGLIEPDRGSRFVQPGATVRYLPQEPDFAGATSTLAYVEAGLAPGDDRHRAHYLLEQLGLNGEEDPARLSGGEARRAALARVLAPDPDVLLLDEPTNHLDLTTIDWLERELAARRGALVVISHDRRFLANLSRATIWLDRGMTRCIERGFAGFEAWRDEALAEEEREQHKLDRKIVAEEHWLRYGVTARRKRNVRRLGALQALRESRRAYRATVGKAAISATAADASGKLVIEADRIAKSYDGRPIVRDFSIRIQRGDRIGIIGPNGSGKTTLINLLTGALAPDAGAVRLGANLAIATLDQHRERLDPTATVAEALTGSRGDTVVIGGQARHVVGYMKDFLFAEVQRGTPLGVLSGGERGRLMLARALAKPSNLLVLDEPTNDLDLETLELPRCAGRNARRLCRHHHSFEPRPRLPRSRGQCGDRSRWRGPLARICWRLFRHAGAARAGPATDRARRGPARASKRIERPQGHRTCAQARKTATKLSRKARARNFAEIDRRVAG